MSSTTADLSIYKTNISEPGVLVQANDLWVPKKEAAEVRQPGNIVFEDLASSMGVDLGGWSWGAQFGDLNNDGKLDLYLVNGYVSAGERSSYWYDFAQIAVGHSAIIGDAQNWPAMKGTQPVRLPAKARLDQRRPGPVHRRRAGRRSHRRVRRPGGRPRRSLESRRARRHRRQPARPAADLQNTVQPGRHWIDFDLEGTTSNSSAIGARDRACTGTASVQVQEVSGGSGFSAQNQRRVALRPGCAWPRSIASRSAGRPAGSRPSRSRRLISDLRQGTQ